MKNRLHDKKAGIAILVALIIISLAEIIFRAVAMGLEAVLTTANFGEQLAVIVLAVTILVLNAKGKDRACYILYGAWIAYFVFDQIFELPGMIVTLADKISVPIMALAIAFRLIIMIGIIVIGALLVEYMSDGTIYNKAFNSVCVIVVSILALDICRGIYGLAFLTPVQNIMKSHGMLVIFNDIYCLLMIFLFTFFAYDSAKLELRKTNLSK